MNGEKLTDDQKSELINQVKAQVMIAHAKEVLTRVTESCYKKCITKPGTSLDSSDQKCVSLCMDRYMDAHKIVSNTFAGRIQRESGGGGF